MKIAVKNLQKKISIYPKKIKNLALGILSKEGVRKTGEITISFVNDRKIRGLNLRYLGKDRPTDVLAFNITEAPYISKDIFADIVISTDTAIRNARIFKTSRPYELYLYVIHGLLHILGYEDKSKKEKTAMHKKEAFLMERICPSIQPKV